MSQRPSAYDAHQCARWIRHDAHLWIQPNIARWMKPGVDPADVIPALARDRAQAEEAKERALAAKDAAFAAQIAASRRLLAVLRVEVDELKAELKRRRVEEAKYSPDQPRIPKRNPGGGQWTRIGGGVGQSPSSNIAQPMGNVDVGAESSETGGLFNIALGGTGTNSANVSGSVVKIAAADPEQFYSPVLAEEEAIGGHTLRRHTDRTDDSLIDWLNSDYKRIRTGNLEITEFPEAEGAFRSREDANDLVNQVLQRNKDKVDQVAAGKLDYAKLQHRFGSVTGREAFRPNGDSEPYIRDTYSVRVVIRHDKRSWRGYRVHTAFPVND